VCSEIPGNITASKFANNAEFDTTIKGKTGLLNLCITLKIEALILHSVSVSFGLVSVSEEKVSVSKKFLSFLVLLSTNNPVHHCIIFIMHAVFKPNCNITKKRTGTNELIILEKNFDLQLIQIQTKRTYFFPI